MDDSLSIKKTCASCGLAKPFSAFLQLGGAEGAIYGNICADCRKANLGKEVVNKENEDSTTVKTGDRIDAKARVFQEVEKKERFEKKEIDEKILHDKKEKLLKTKQLKIDKTAKAERSHREDYLKKGSFLSDKSVDKILAGEKKQKTEKTDKQRATKAEEKLKTIDLTNPYIPSQSGPLAKLQSSVFLQFKAWLGNSSPLVNNLNAAKSPNSGIKPTSSGDAAKTKADEKSLTDHINKTWKPNR